MFVFNDGVLVGYENIAGTADALTVRSVEALKRTDMLASRERANRDILQVRDVKQIIGRSVGRRPGGPRLTPWT
jgi:hypothetical protein